MKVQGNIFVIRRLWLSALLASLLLAHIFPVRCSFSNNRFVAYINFGSDSAQIIQCTSLCTEPTAFPFIGLAPGTHEHKTKLVDGFIYSTCLPCWSGLRE